MERAKHRIIILSLLIIFGFEVSASYRSEIYHAYVNNRMELWKDVIDRMNVIPDKSDELTLELVNYQYGYIGWCIGYNRKSEARKYLDLAQKNLEILEKRNYRLSTVYAYQSAFYGFRIGLNFLSVPVNGVKSIEFAEKAIRFNNEDHFAFIQGGNIQFYMPKSIGGSKKEGMEYFLKAKEILERDPENLKENWNYLSLLILIGQSYYYLDDYASSKSTFEYILKLEPGFTYVRDEIYPQLLKKMNEK